MTTLLITLIKFVFAILANDRLAKDTYRVRLDAPQLSMHHTSSSHALPGQVFMLRIAWPGNDPLIGRALLALFVSRWWTGTGLTWPKANSLRDSLVCRPANLSM